MADVFAMEDARKRKRETKVFVGVDPCRGELPLPPRPSHALLRQKIDRGKDVQGLFPKKPRKHVYEAATNGTEQAIGTRPLASLSAPSSLSHTAFQNRSREIEDELLSRLDKASQAR